MDSPVYYLYIIYRLYKKAESLCNKKYHKLMFSIMNDKSFCKQIPSVVQNLQQLFWIKTMNTVLLSSKNIKHKCICSYFAAFVLVCFHQMKKWSILFWSETNLMSLCILWCLFKKVLLFTFSDSLKCIWNLLRDPVHIILAFFILFSMVNTFICIRKN